jgi:succinate dehydrogenase/fumarate reductase cytochrome b subunit
MALAQQNANPQYVRSLIDSAKGLLDQLVVFLIALAVVWFIWNVIRYTMSDDEEKKGAAKSQMIWGVVAIAVIVSVWGLVAILQGIFGVQTVGAGNVNQLLPNRSN